MSRIRTYRAIVHEDVPPRTEDSRGRSRIITYHMTWLYYIVYDITLWYSVTLCYIMSLLLMCSISSCYSILCYRLCYSLYNVSISSCYFMSSSYGGRGRSRICILSTSVHASHTYWHLPCNMICLTYVHSPTTIGMSLLLRRTGPLARALLGRRGRSDPLQTLYIQQQQQQ